MHQLVLKYLHIYVFSQTKCDVTKGQLNRSQNNVLLAKVGKTVLLQNQFWIMSTLKHGPLEWFINFALSSSNKLQGKIAVKLELCQIFYPTIYAITNIALPTYI